MEGRRYLDLLKWSLYVINAVMILFLQDYLFVHFKIFGVHPMFAAAVVSSVALFEGALPGAVFGMFIGFVHALPINGGEGYFAFVYAASGFICGAVCEYMFGKRLVTVLLWSFIINVVVTLGYFFFYFFIPGKAGGMALVSTGIPEMIYSSAVTPIAYFPIREVARRLGTEEDEG